ncbi:hypothetical protein HYW76_04740 [Candidatus Pacearchaeota archaeon]|nr:hypothetical protein [Candidatus Pacearchaeota archaeon]
MIRTHKDGKIDVLCGRISEDGNSRKCNPEGLEGDFLMHTPLGDCPYAKPSRVIDKG